MKTEKEMRKEKVVVIYDEAGSGEFEPNELKELTKKIKEHLKNNKIKYNGCLKERAEHVFVVDGKERKGMSTLGIQATQCLQSKKKK